LVIRKSL